MERVCKFCGKGIVVGRFLYCSTECARLADVKRKREQRQAERAQVQITVCRYNKGIDCPDCGGCAVLRVESGGDIK